jgi:hypothetical protein
MITIKELNVGLIAGIVAALTAGCFAAQTATAAQYGGEETAALLEVLGNSKHSLADGAKQVATGGEIAISAKFELDDNKQLSLSVYTAEKGLKEDPEHNVLKEWSGSPEQAAWAPEAEVFKDLPHVSRASEHLTLMSLAKQNLVQFISTAQRQHKGTVFSAIPEVSGHRLVLVVLIADHGKVKQVRYDLETGRALPRG